MLCDSCSLFSALKLSVLTLEQLKWQVQTHLKSCRPWRMVSNIRRFTLAKIQPSNCTSDKVPYSV
jgi:hypothetical protein